MIRRDGRVRTSDDPVLETGALPLSYIPMKTRNRPPGGVLGAVPAYPHGGVYNGTFSPDPGSIGCEKAL